MIRSRLVRDPGVEKVIALLILLAAAVSGCGGEPDLTVYTAASLADALEEAAGKFESRTGISVAIRPGASGALSMSIENGAPADVFVSASPEWMEHLVSREMVDPAEVRLLGWNRIVMIVPADRVTEGETGLLDLPNLNTIAMGDPDFVPAGRYAAQGLKSLEAWDILQDRLVLVQDVRAALALVERGEADAGLVYASDAAASDRVHVAYTFPDKTHDPVVYPAAALRRSPRADEARQFLDFLSGTEGKDVFRKYGLGGG